MPSVARKAFRPRWLAALSAAADIPLSAAASLSDSPRSLSSRTACRCPEGNLSIASRSPRRPESNAWRFGPGAEMVSCFGSSEVSAAALLPRRRSRSAMRRLAIASNPRTEGSTSIVGLARGVQRKEDILDGVLRLAGQPAMPCRQRP